MTMQEPQHYVKKPICTWLTSTCRFRIPIQAVKITSDNILSLASWCGGQAISIMLPSNPPQDGSILRVPTLEGVMTAKIGDYIIKDTHDEFYPCRGDIFEINYMPTANTAGGTDWTAGE